MTEVRLLAASRFFSQVVFVASPRPRARPFPVAPEKRLLTLPSLFQERASSVSFPPREQPSDSAVLPPSPSILPSSLAFPGLSSSPSPMPTGAFYPPLSVEAVSRAVRGATKV